MMEDLLPDPEPYDPDASDADDAIDALLPHGTSVGALIEAMENRGVFPPIARGDAYRLMAHMRARFNDPTFTIAQRMEYLRHLTKIGNVEAREEVPTGAGLPIIQIIVPGSPELALTPVGPQIIDIDDYEDD